MNSLEKYLYNKKLEKMLRLEESASNLREWKFEDVIINGPKNEFEKETLKRINYLLKLRFLIGEKITVLGTEYYIEDVEEELGGVFLKLISADDLCNLGGRRLSYEELSEYSKTVDWDKFEDIKVEEDIRIPYTPCNI